MDDFTVEVHHGGSFAHDPLRLPTVSMEDGGLRVVSIDSDKEQQPRQQLVHTQDPMHTLNQQPVFMATQQLLQPQQQGELQQVS
uniref:Uncharacterized protein n=1 Tax=Fagus sylvatica TaxID=28930 RepID=A0A2N9EKK1_FAGSY